MPYLLSPTDHGLLILMVGGSILGVKFLDPLAGIIVSGMILKVGLETGYQRFQFNSPSDLVLSIYDISVSLHKLKWNMYSGFLINVYSTSCIFCTVNSYEAPTPLDVEVLLSDKGTREHGETCTPIIKFKFKFFRGIRGDTAGILMGIR